jgi:hypothetical protein
VSVTIATLSHALRRDRAQGRFHGSYRFNVFVGPGDYKLRVLAKAETDYPFSAGTSNVIRVRVT